MTRDISSAGSSVFRGPAPLALALVCSLSPALAPGCGGDDGDGGADAGDDGADSGTGGADAAPGADGSTGRTTDYVANPAGIIQLIEGFAGADGVSAALRDRPDLPPATLLASEGDCEIWTHSLEPARCDPPCQDGLCVADDRCEPFPRPVSAGEIEVTGLNQALRFVPAEFGYAPDPELPPKDLFADAAAVTATAAGDEAPGFTLSGDGVVPLVADLDLDFDVTLVIEDGVDEVIRWTGEASGRAQLALQVGHHGSPYEALLLCETDDDGELVVPGSLIERFPRQSNGLEQHFSWFARFTRDVVASDAGPVELFVASRVLIPQLDHR